MLPRVGDLPVFATMLPKTIEETGAAARWSFYILRTDLEVAARARNITKWFYLNWEAGPDGDEPPSSALPSAGEIMDDFPRTQFWETVYQ